MPARWRGGEGRYSRAGHQGEAAPRGRLRVKRPRPCRPPTIGHGWRGRNANATSNAMQTQGKRSTAFEPKRTLGHPKRNAMQWSALVPVSGGRRAGAAAHHGLQPCMDARPRGILRNRAPYKLLTTAGGKGRVEHCIRLVPLHPFLMKTGAGEEHEKGLTIPVPPG